MKKNRWLPYLILNILVSATTTLLVLTWFERTQHPETINTTPQTISIATQAAATVTLPPTDTAVIEIKTVYGVGDLQTEAVMLSRLGETQLELSGWQIKDQDDHVFTFPKLALNKDGAVQINTRSGADTVIELFWGQKRAIWQSGELVSLFDPAGNLRASFQIP